MRCNEDVEQNLRERFNLSQYFHSTINSYFCVIKVKAVAQLFWMMMKAILRKRRRKFWRAIKITTVIKKETFEKFSQFHSHI